MKTLRLLAVGWWFQLKMISRSPFEGVGQGIYPLFFATVAFFVFRAGDSPRTLLYASLGAAVMGMWSATSTTAGNAMQRERWHGTLEALVATPPHFAAPPRRLPFRHRPDGRASARLRPGRGRHGALLRLTWVPLRRLLRPLPCGLGARQPLRVPRVADRRLPRPARAVAEMGRPDRLGARADLGDERDPGGRARRDAHRGPRPVHGRTHDLLDRQ